MKMNVICLSSFQAVKCNCTCAIYSTWHIWKNLRTYFYFPLYIAY